MSTNPCSATVPFPKLEQMEGIVSNRLGLFTGGSSAFLKDALDLFYKLRGPGSAFRKKPATAELLDWMRALLDASEGVENPLATAPHLASDTASSLTKTVEDQEKAALIVQQWVKQRLTQIIRERLNLHDEKNNPFLDDALDLFFLLREPTSNLRQRPATDELLDWMKALLDASEAVTNPLAPGSDTVLLSLSRLIKTDEDQEKAKHLAQQWLQQRTNKTQRT